MSLNNGVATALKTKYNYRKGCIIKTEFYSKLRINYGCWRHYTIKNEILGSQNGKQKSAWMICKTNVRWSNSRIELYLQNIKKINRYYVLKIIRFNILFNIEVIKKKKLFYFYHNWQKKERWVKVTVRKWGTNCCK